MTAATRLPTDPAMASAAEALDALAATCRALASLPPGVPSLEAAGVRLERGVPALAGEPLLDGPGLAASLDQLGHRLAEIDGYESSTVMADAIRRRCAAPDLELIAAAALTGLWDEVRQLAVRLDLEPDASIALLDWAARPSLRAGASAVERLVAAVAWNRPTCPACGAAPGLSVRTGKEGDRFLYCGRCGTGWRFVRVRCPACGESDHRRLGALHAPGEGEYRRAEICDTCGCYLKSIAALDRLDAHRVLRLDLETAGLDFMAIDRGYRPAGTIPHAR